MFRTIHCTWVQCVTHERSKDPSCYDFKYSYCRKATSAIITVTRWRRNISQQNSNTVHWELFVEGNQTCSSFVGWCSTATADDEGPQYLFFTLSMAWTLPSNPNKNQSWLVGWDHLLYLVRYCTCRAVWFFGNILSQWNTDLVTVQWLGLEVRQ